MSVKILPVHGYVNYDSLDSSEHNTTEVLQNFSFPPILIY